MVWFPAACGLLAIGYLRLVVPRLPLPDPADGPTPNYQATARLPGYIVVGFMSAIGGLLVCLALPLPEWWAWFGYLAVGAPLAWVDLQTTYLPIHATWLCGCLVGLGVMLGAFWNPWSLLGGLLGAVASFILFYLVWRLSGSLGFGDVRLAAIIGALTGAHGLQSWSQSVLLGTVIGGCWGVVHWIRHRDRSRIFPYGPALWLGPIAALAISYW